MPIGACVPAALNTVFRSAPSEQYEPDQATTHFAGLVASQQRPISKIVTTQLDTQTAILEMCTKAEGLSPTQLHQLKALCLRYDNVFNAGDKPLSKTNLTTFSVEVAPQ